MYSITLKDLVEKALYLAKEYLNIPGIDNLKNVDWSSILSIVSSIGMWIILIAFSAFSLWLLRSIGIYKMAKNNGDKLAFIAFIPYGCLFVMGRIIGKARLFGIDIEYPEYILPALLITMALPFTSSLSTILFVLFYYGILYKIYKLKWKGFAVVSTIISIFVPFVQPFFLFFIKNM